MILSLKKELIVFRRQKKGSRIKRERIVLNKVANENGTVKLYFPHIYKRTFMQSVSYGSLC